MINNGNIMRHAHNKPNHDDHGHTHGRRFARGERGGPDSPRRSRGGPGALGRFFAHGDLRLVLLHLIAKKPRHGYELIRAIEEGVAGAYSPSPGVIYPTLTLLDELGYVTVTPGEGAKKLHTITPEGEAFLVANRKTLDTLLARMAEATRAHAGDPAPQIVRSMENLKRALRLRLALGPFTEAAADAVAAALDQAAQAVEGA